MADELPAYTPRQSPTSGSSQPPPSYGVRTVSDDLQSMDDERRMVPQGWVRAFDRSSRNHFYVESRTGRAIWRHPYDDDEFLSTLSKDHPGHPESPAGIRAARRAAAEADGGEHVAGLKGPKRWLAKRKHEHMYGEAEMREVIAKKRAFGPWRAGFARRRDMLTNGNINDASIRQLYADRPFQYTPPDVPRASSFGSALSPYGYGFRERWYKRYEPELSPETLQADSRLRRGIILNSLNGGGFVMNSGGGGVF